MITKPTTLILGAGASAPFGFPTGQALLKKVLTLTDPPALSTQRQNFIPQGVDLMEVARFHNELLKSGKESVDSFLEHRPEFIPIGKLTIALSLIPLENETGLFSLSGNNWYRYLFNQLNTTFDDFEKNKLSILTFNYDRSLEHFLLTALMSSYGKSAEECVQTMAKIPIIHLHGDLGGLPPLERGGVRAYNPEISTIAVNIASKRIRIIHESIEEDSQFMCARKILRDSTIICFLGFGYHKTNMERLNFKNAPDSTPPYKKIGGAINGTSFNMTDAECGEVLRRNGVSLRIAGSHDYGKYDVLRFLREMGTLHG